MMKAIGVVKRWSRCASVAGAVVAIWAVVSVARVDRIDLFDKSDNPLLFVTFQYDASGNNIGRDIFAADSTFLRHTSFQTNGQGQITKETSTNFDTTMIFYTNLTTSGNTITFSTFDQFGLDQFGGALTSTTSDQKTYALSQGGASLYQIKYTLSGTSIQRIDVCDNSGSTLYYAMMGSTPARPFAGIRAAPYSSVASLGKGRFRVNCDLARPSGVALELFDMSGRRAAVVLNKRYEEGSHSIFVDASPSRGVGNGAYVVRLSIDGRPVARGLFVIER